MRTAGGGRVRSPAGGLRGPGGGGGTTTPPAGAPPRPPPPPPRPPPNTSFTRTFGNLWVCPVAVSPIQISLPAAVELVNAKWLPSGLKRAPLSLGFGGRAILISVPSGILRSNRFDSKVVLCRP